MPIRVVSFDMEGTLVDHSFSRSIWEEAIPKLFAESRGLSLEEATRIVLAEYNSIGEEKPEWYDVDYWWRRLNLPGDWRKKLIENEKSCFVYSDVHMVLDDIGGRYPIIVSSNTIRDFLNVQLKCINYAFHKVYSAPSDFGIVKSQPAFFDNICRDLLISPNELAHVGDHAEFDYRIAKMLGVKAYLLDRSGEMNGPDVVHDLFEFCRKLHQV